MATCRLTLYGPPHQLRKRYCNVYKQSIILVHIQAKYQHSTIFRVRKHGSIIHSNKTVQVHNHHIEFTSEYKSLYMVLVVQKMNLQVEQKIRRMLTSCNWTTRELTEIRTEGLLESRLLFQIRLIYYSGILLNVRFRI